MTGPVCWDGAAYSPTVCICATPNVSGWERPVPPLPIAPRPICFWGLLNLQQLQQFGVRIGLGTDVGAGTSFSLFRTMAEAYKIQQLRGHALDPLQAFYQATLGAADALDLADRIGNLAPDKDADFVILDLDATSLLTFRLQECRDARELLFVLNTLGDDRLVQATYAAGKCVHRRGGHG